MYSSGIVTPAVIIMIITVNAMYKNYNFVKTAIYDYIFAFYQTIQCTTILYGNNKPIVHKLLLMLP